MTVSDVFWPWLNCDVSMSSRATYASSLVNQVSFKLAPLSPVQPHEHLIIDCVGPSIPPSVWLCVHAVCQTMRYPAAFPLRSISVKPVVRTLTQFISTFGILRVIKRPGF